MAAGASEVADKHLARFIMHTKGANLLWRCVAPDITVFTSFQDYTLKLSSSSDLNISGESFEPSIKASFILSIP